MSTYAKEVLLALSLKYDGNYEKIVDEIKNKTNRFPKDEMEKWKGNIKSNVVTIVDDNYPQCFKTIFSPPIVLYYYGNLSLLEKTYKITCIGTRKPTLYQTDTCYNFIKEAIKAFDNDLVVISGMAHGLDQTFMRAAMELNAPVVSIIGSGIDNPYPKVNDGLYEYCKSNNGLIISEYPNELQAKPENFLFRNRLLAGGSEILFLGGASLHSGSQATVRYAVDLGKEIVALPCNVTGDDLTNYIIKDGAGMILSSNDLIYEIKSACKNNS